MIDTEALLSKIQNKKKLGPEDIMDDQFIGLSTSNHHPIQHAQHNYSNTQIQHTFPSNPNHTEAKANSVPAPITAGDEDELLSQLRNESAINAAAPDHPRRNINGDQNHFHAERFTP